jgi:acid phosphatase family membrane protein YuiD
MELADWYLRSVLDKTIYSLHRCIMLREIPINLTAFRDLLENQIFLSTIFSLLSAQVLKVIVSLLSGRRKKARELVEVLTWRTGGMPSSHAAVVCSLFTSVAFVEGLASNLCIFSACFALVVLRDAMGVRRSAGLMAKALNDMAKKLSEKTGVEYRLVKEIQGHTPQEVAFGCLLGIVVATSICLVHP